LLLGGELFDPCANSLDKRLDIDDDSIGRQLAFVGGRWTVFPLIEDWTGVTCCA